MKIPNPASIALALALASSATAQVVNIQSITYTGTAPVESGINLGDANNLINGSGLSETLTLANIDTVTHSAPSFAAPGNAWTTNSPNPDFFAAPSGTVVFEVILDESYNIRDFYNWSYDFNEGTGNGNNIRTVNIDYGVGDFASSLANVELAPTTTNNLATKTPLNITADRVRITVTDNYFGVGGVGGGDRVSAAEFAFTGFAATVDPALLAPASADVSSDDASTAKTLTIPVNNWGGANDLIITDLQFSGTNAASFTALTGLPLTIAPGATGDIEVSFDPAGGSGDFTASLEITSNAVNTPTTSVSLSGSVSDPILVAPEAVEATSNNATGTEAITVSIDNTGVSNNLEITDIQISGLDADLFSVVTTTPLIIAPGASANIELEFNAGGFANLYTASLDITSNYAASPTTSVTLSVDVIDPVISAPEAIDLPILLTNEATEFTVTIENQGGSEDLEIFDALIGGPDAAFFSLVTDLVTTPFLIAPGASADLTFSFDPAGESRSFSAIIDIDSNDFTTIPPQIDLSARYLDNAPPAGSIRLIGNSFYDNTSPGTATGLIGIDGVAPFTPDFYDNSIVPPSSAANIYYDADGDQLFTSPEDTSGNTDESLAFDVLGDGTKVTVLNLYVQSFTDDASGQSKIATNFAANAVRFTGLEFLFSDGTIEPLDVTAGTPQTFSDPSGKEWTVTLAGVGLVDDIVSNIDSIPGNGQDYHFTLTLTPAGASVPDFSSWATDNAIPNQATYDAGDSDGIPALVEYALGLDPNTSETLPQISVASGNPSITWTKGAQAATDSTITYQVEGSSTLQADSWTPLTEGVDYTESPTEITLTDTSGANASFVRLRIVQSAP